MTTDARRFDSIERVVRDERRRVDDLQSTVMARLATHTHGDSGGGGAVESVNGQTGAVVLDAADVGAATTADVAAKLDTADAPELVRDTMASALVAGSNVTITPNDGSDTITISASGGGGGGAVDSVNGQTGAVVLDADDVGAAAASHTHAASAISSGTLAIGRIPTGTTSSTVSLGNHDHDSRYAKGVVAQYARTTTSTGSTSITGVRACYTWCTVESGRMYRVYAHFGLLSSSVAHAEVLIRYTTNNTIPTTSSPILAKGQGYVPVAGGYTFSTTVEGIYTPTVGFSGFVVGLFIGWISGTSSVSAYGDSTFPTRITIEDVGAAYSLHGGD